MTDTDAVVGKTANALFLLQGRTLAVASDYFALLKPRVMSLSIFTAFVGMILAPSTEHPLRLVLAILSIAAGAGAAGAINMWYDRDIDRLMERTKDRPVAAGRVDPSRALIFGSVIGAGAVLALGLATNWLAASLLAGTILFYVVVYTAWLKRLTPQNIVIGGAAGALPPVVGWVAASGDLAWGPISLFVLIFLWTPPHFWALALYKNSDFKAADLPMLPLVRGGAATKRQIFIYAALLLPGAALPTLMGIAGPTYLLASIFLSGRFVIKAHRLMNLADEHHDKAARNLFGYSIMYLFALFVVLLAERAMSWLMVAI